MSLGAAADNTENNTGVILKSLIQFPADYMFQVVGQPSIQPGCTKEDFIQEMVDVVQSVCQESILDSNVEVVDRMRGKYVSLKVTCRVKTPELVAAVFSRLEGDQRVKMKFCNDDDAHGIYKWKLAFEKRRAK
eukprot:347701-Chlamydomonas_euryale.AAC.12